MQVLDEKLLMAVSAGASISDGEMNAMGMGFLVGGAAAGLASLSLGTLAHSGSLIVFAPVVATVGAIVGSIVAYNL